MYQMLLHEAPPEVKWKPWRSHLGKMPYPLKSARAQPPGPKKTRDELSLSGLFSLPIQSPDTFYQVRQPLGTQCPQSALLCFVFKGSLISVGPLLPPSHLLYSYSKRSFISKKWVAQGYDVVGPGDSLGSWDQMDSGSLKV